MKNSVQINQIIEIEIEAGFDYSGKYKTRIENINDYGVVLAMPMEKGNLIPLRPGTEVIFWQWDNAASYAHYCKVRERIFEPLPLVFIDWPYKTTKIQRRSFVRVPVNLKIEYALKEDKPDVLYNSAYIKDLSGGGTQFYSKKARFKKDDMLKVKVHLPEEIIQCNAKVVWVVDDVCDNITRHFVGVEFDELPERLRDKLISYVFTRQRELIKKGVL